MAIALTEDDIRFTGIDSSGKRTAIRYMVLSYGQDDDSMDLAESTLLPKIGDLHPVYTAWSVQSIGEPKWSDSPRLFTLEVTYSMNNTGGGFVGQQSKGKKPWELGPQNFQISTYDIEEPLLKLYDPDIKVNDGDGEKKGAYKDLVNTAGDRILATHPCTVTRIAFQLHYKHTEGNTVAQNDDYSYNSESVKVCNITIPAYAGKLLPFSTSLHTVYKADGKTVDYEYETAEITIDIRKKDTWLLQYLNVGTQAKWGRITEDEEDPYEEYKGAAYRYHELANANDIPSVDNMVIGPLEEALAAKKVYTDAGGKAGNFPIEEITEPFPLTQSGEIDRDAYVGGGEYTKVTGYSRAGESWTKYNLPKTI